MKDILLNFYLFILFCGVLPSISNAQNPELKLTEIASGLFHPTDVASVGDGRLFVSQLDGKIQIVQNGNILNTPFLDISSKIRDAEWGGIFGFTFHPNYTQNGFLYVHYVQKNAEASVYARYTRSINNPNIVDPNSEQIILVVPYPANGHRSGHLAFGRDGFLYITTGDGAAGARGSIGDTDGNAQNLQNLFGKILRIDVNNGSSYSIPSTNPYQNAGDNIPDEIWARGLRNPWHWSFDKETGDLWIGDNGQDDWEEVDFAPNNHAGGLNYGWRCYEGSHPYVGTGCGDASNYVMPLLDYAGYNSNGIGGSVLGGFVYRGTQFQSLRGWYVYGDYQTGKFWTLKRNANGTFQNVLQNITLSNPVSFGEEPNGELYVATFYEGKLYKISTNVIESVNSGNWNNTSTWSCNCIPTANDEVIIQTPHNVTLTQNTNVKYLQIKGNLIFNGNQVLGLAN
jgi:glucose/arabinose dehydrogenase